MPSIDEKISIVKFIYNEYVVGVLGRYAQQNIHGHPKTICFRMELAA